LNHYLQVEALHIQLNLQVLRWISITTTEMTLFILDYAGFAD